TRTGFTTGSNLFTNVTAPAGQTLSVSSTGGGSFAFAISYQVFAASPAGTPEGNYNGSIAVSGSPLAAANKTVSVVLHVASQPIAYYAPDAVRFRIAQGAAKVEKWVQFSNRGLGTLTLSSVAVNGTAAWLAATVDGSIVKLTADPAGLSPGS